MRIAEQFFNNLIKQFVWVLVGNDDQQDYQQHKLLCEFIELFLSFFIKDICDC